jgi:protein SCO1/2
MAIRVGALVLLLAIAVHADDATLKAGVFDPPRAAPDFTLRGSDGKDVSLAHYRDKVVLLAFGYTHCPTVCPTTLATLASAHKRLGEDGGKLQVVYVTVDPEHDDVARLRDYLGQVDPAFVGATGTPAELEAVRRDYGVFAKKADDAGYFYSHSSSIYLIDRAGMLRAMMPYGQPPESFVHDVRILLGRPGTEGGS